MQSPHLNSAEICLRPFHASDADAFVIATRESVVSVVPWLPWCHSEYSVAEAQQWFSRCAQRLEEESAYEFGILSADGSELIGGIGLNEFRKQHQLCNLGYWVRTLWQRRGIATQAIHLLAEFGFQELGLTRIEIVVAEGNEVSTGVAKNPPPFLKLMPAIVWFCMASL